MHKVPTWKIRKLVKAAMLIPKAKSGIWSEVLINYTHNNPPYSQSIKLSITEFCCSNAAPMPFIRCLFSPGGL